MIKKHLIILIFFIAWSFVEGNHDHMPLGSGIKNNHVGTYTGDVEIEYKNEDKESSKKKISSIFSSEKEHKEIRPDSSGSYSSYYSKISGSNIFLPTILSDRSVREGSVANFSDMENLSKTESIIISQSDVIFSFEYNESGLINSDKDRMTYAYKLENYDEDWRYVGDKKYVDYTNLAPGDYVFKIKSTGNNGEWNEIRSLTIKVLPSFWSTWWFKLISALVVMMIGFVMYKLRNKRIEAKRKNLEKEVAQRTIEIKQQRDELERKSAMLENKRKEIEEKNFLLQEKTEEILAQRNNIEEKNRQLEKASNEVLKANQELKRSNISLEAKVEKRTAKLKKVVDELMRSNQEVDTFLYRASHDLKGPITRLLGLTQLAKLDTKNNKEINYLDIIEMSSIDMNKTLNKLINIHSINTKSLEYCPVDFIGLIQEVKKIFLIKLKEYKFRIDLNYHPNTKIISDETLLKIIFENLLENAISFKNVRDPLVIISIADDDNQIVMKIEDNGQGIKKRYQHKIFDMFYRASDTSQGNGLGLYLVKKAVDKLKGEIRVESEEGIFTSFSITIPKQKIFDEQVIGLA